MSEREHSVPKLKQWLRQSAAVVLAYLLATLFTGAYFSGDTSDYVESIVAYNRGEYYEFWEFGHVLWRPLGWLLMRATKPLISSVVDGGLKANATLVLSTASWLAGLVSVLALAAILRRFCLRPWIISCTVFAFILSNGFLNYAQTGTPYLTSLSLMILALYILLRKDKGQLLSMRAGTTAGVLLGLMVCFWLPFIVVIPPVLAAPLLVSSPDMRKAKILIGTAIVAGVLVCVVYAAVAIGAVGVHNVGDFREWMHQTTGKTAQDKGLARTILGFARSFIYMGNDGMLFKRYLVHDPFNPVTVLDLLRLSFWKIIIFYLFLVSIILNLFRSDEGKRLLALLVITAIPVVGVAVYWQGGDIERYLALYPILFLALGYSLCHERSWRALNCVMLIFVVSAALTNVYAMSFHVLNQKQERLSSRIGELTHRLKPSSRVFVINFQDEVYSFTRDFPFNPINRAGNLKVSSLIEVGGKAAPQWRQDFALRAQTAWSQGGDVWVTRRVLSLRPQADWNWVEGDDRRVSWTDFQSFFSQLELGDLAGGDDGFVLVVPSAKTSLVLGQLSK